MLGGDRGKQTGTDIVREEIHHGTGNYKERKGKCLETPSGGPRLVHPNEQEVKQRLQEICMGKERSPGKIQTLKKIKCIEGESRDKYLGRNAETLSKYRGVVRKVKARKTYLEGGR